MKSIRLLISALMLSVSSLLMFVAPHAFAAPITWTGTAGDHKFSTGTNWSGNVAPTTGDSLIFDNTSATDLTPSNDMVGASFAGITFQGSGSTAFAVAGTAFTLTGNITNTTALSQSIDNDITVSGTRTIATGTGAIMLSGVVDGSGSINKTGTGGLWLTGNNAAYTGTITATAGDLVAGTANAFGPGTSPGAVANDGATIALSDCNAFDLNSNLSLTGLSSDTTGDFPKPKLAIDVGACAGGGTDESYGFAANNATVTLKGTMTLGSDITFAGLDSTTTITGALSGAHQLTMLPGYAGKLVVNSSSNTSSTANGTLESAAFTKTLSDNQAAHTVGIAGNTVLTIDGTRGDTTVGSGATLMGGGTVGALDVQSGGTVAPGHSPGCITSGNLVLNGAYNAEIGGTTACTEYDQLKVTGTVDITGATLNVSLFNGFKPAVGQKYTIIDNDASDAVTGTFAGLAQGATVTVGGYTLSVSYTGGDGNDVVLTVTGGAPNTGFALIANNPFVGTSLILAAAGTIAFMARRQLKPAVARSKRR